MKSIKEYINESLLDDEDDLIENNDILIQNFLKKNYRIYGNISIKNNIVDVDGDVMVKNKTIKSLTDSFFTFGNVDGIFNCQKCISLTSLEGAPEKVGKNFDCSYCGSLKTLEGSPKEVGGSFYCNWCKSLTNLEGAPQKVGFNFDCGGCNSLKTLEGAPEQIEGYLYCKYCPKLKSFKVFKGIEIKK